MNIDFYKRLVFYFFLLVLPVLTVGCSSHTKSVNPDEEIKIDKDKGIFFGIIKHTPENTATNSHNIKFVFTIKKSGPLLAELYYPQLSLLSLAGEINILHSTEMDQTLFVHHVKAGEYKFRYLSAGGGNYTIPSGSMSFNVVPQKSTYIGSFEIYYEFDKHNNYVLVKNIGIYDDRYAVTKLFKEKYTSLGNEVVTNMPLFDVILLGFPQFFD